jgi:DNA primase
MSDWSLIRDQIKERVRLSEIVGRKVAFDRRKSQPGRGEFWACCPFHSEKSPSFHVLDREGYYKCFGCGAAGDVVGFVMDTENRSYPEAMAMLAELAGLELPKPSAAEREKAVARASLHEILERAAKFFEQVLGAKEGNEARAYLEKRGLPRETWAKFRLGYAPGNSRALMDHLKGAKISVEEMRAAGLLSSREEPADLFRNRLMFPITDGRGRVIAFGGRALEADAQIKYLNSPETELFHKGRTLYNFAAARRRPHRATGAAATFDRLVVAEGYMDVIALVRAGLDRAVAPLGTALTAEQLELLWSIEPAPVIAFDGDAAGRAAAARALDRALPLLKPGRTLSFAFLPQGQDPDDLLRTRGPAALVGTIEQAEPLAEVLWAVRTQAANLASPDGRAAAEAALREAVQTIGDVQVRRHYEAFVRERVAGWMRAKRPASANSEWRVTNRNSRSQFAPRDFAARPGAAPRPSQELRSRQRAAPNPAEETLVLALLTHPALAADLAEELAATPLSDPRLDRMRAEILTMLAADEGLGAGALETRLQPLGLAGLAKSLLAREGLRCLPCANPAAEPQAARASLREVLVTLHTNQEQGERTAALGAALEGEISDESWGRARILHLAARRDPRR